MRFQVRVCENGGCLFRFPVPAGSRDGECCPHCRQPTVYATPPFASHEAPLGKRLGQNFPIVAVLDNIRSTFNVGSMFRVADGAGLARLYLCGVTATPENGKVRKTALGAEEAVAWTHYLNGVEAVRGLKEAGYEVWGIEGGDRSRDLMRFRPGLPAHPLAFVVGNEKSGIDPAILHLCDHIWHIPMYGHKRSLNVANAFGIVAYFLQHLSLTSPRSL